MSKAILVVICEKKLLFVRPDPREKWGVPFCDFDSELTSLKVEMALAKFFKEISIQPVLIKLEDGDEFPYYICHVKGKPRAHEYGKTWFASRHNFLPTVLTDEANRTVNIPAVTSRL